MSDANDPHSEQLNQVIADYLAALESEDAPDQDDEQTEG
mgnify:CR=1 FL=1